MKFHSVSDIITNSSQEYYTLYTDLTKEKVERLLDSIFSIISEYGNPFHVVDEKNGEFTITTDGYYWGFFDCPSDDEKQDIFEAILKECPSIKDWERFQRG